MTIDPANLDYSVAPGTLSEDENGRMEVFNGLTWEYLVDVMLEAERREATLTTIDPETLQRAYEDMFEDQDSDVGGRLTEESRGIISNIITARHSSNSSGNMGQISTVSTVSGQLSISDGTDWHDLGDTSATFAVNPTVRPPYVRTDLEEEQGYVQNNRANLYIIRNADSKKPEETRIDEGAGHIEYYTVDNPELMEFAVSYPQLGLPQVIQDLQPNEKVTFVVDTCIDINWDTDSPDHFEAKFMRVIFKDVTPKLDFAASAGDTTMSSIKIVATTENFSLFNTYLIRINKETMQYEPAS